MPNHSFSNYACQFGAGAVGAPSVYFSTDTTTGWYRSAANEICATVSGTPVMTIKAGIGSRSELRRRGHRPVSLRHESIRLHGGWCSAVCDWVNEYLVSRFQRRPQCSLGYGFLFLQQRHSASPHELLLRTGHRSESGEPAKRRRKRVIPFSFLGHGHDIQHRCEDDGARNGKSQ
jgi:hypothetical protein